MGVYHGDKNRRWSPSKNNHTLNDMCWCRPYCIPLSHQWKSYVYQHNKNKCGATPFSFICVNIGVYHGYENRHWSPSKTNLILNDMCGCRPHFIPLSHQWKSQVDQNDEKGCGATPFLVACTQLYKSLCRSVGRSVGRSVCRSVPLCFFCVFRLFNGREAHIWEFSEL